MHIYICTHVIPCSLKKFVCVSFFWKLQIKYKNNKRSCWNWDAARRTRLFFLVCSNEPSVSSKEPCISAKKVSLYPQTVLYSRKRALYLRKRDTHANTLMNVYVHTCMITYMCIYKSMYALIYTQTHTCIDIDIHTIKYTHVHA